MTEQLMTIQTIKKTGYTLLLTGCILCCLLAATAIQPACATEPAQPVPAFNATPTASATSDVFQTLSTRTLQYSEADSTSLLKEIQGLNTLPSTSEQGALTWQTVVNQTLSQNTDIKLSQEKINEMEYKREDVETKRILFFFKYFDATFLEGSAESDVMAAAAHHQSVVQLALLDSLDGYFKLMRALLGQSVTFQQIQQGKLQLKLNEHRFNTGEGTRLDMAQTQAQLIQRYQDYLQATQRIEDAYLLLATKLGLPPNPVQRPAELRWEQSPQNTEATLDLEIPRLAFFTKHPVPAEEQLIKMALERRPDMRELQLKQLSLENLYKLSRVKFHKAQEKVLQSNIKQLDFKESQLKASISASVIGQKHHWDLKKEQLRLTENQFLLAKLTLGQTQKAHLAGFSSNKDVLDAQTALAQAESLFANALLDENLAQLKLLYELGLLTPENLLKGEVEL